MPLRGTTWHENRAVAQRRLAEYKGLTPIFIAGEYRFAKREGLEETSAEDPSRECELNRIKKLQAGHRSPAKFTDAI